MGHFTVANLVTLPLAHTYEKDELQCLGTLCGRDHTQKSSQRASQAKVLALIMAENGHDMTLSRLIRLHDRLKLAKADDNCYVTRVAKEEIIFALQSILH
jgi:hypothetical protein